MFCNKKDAKLSEITVFCFQHGDHDLVAQAHILTFLCGAFNRNSSAMSGSNYGRKGSCFMLFLGAILLFVILLIWVYRMNLPLSF